ncbi:hypothetical protein DSO57_1031846 [Entomophthora muscae]|uniref:Uncharacterized protein n=1 Tax=Entomophthora muscae TaxID=34485 RepID=A0ACC2T0U0_9FUNG|nr:hypothetical protein DSO57_1031846 [Entomophthora muscae]
MSESTDLAFLCPSSSLEVLNAAWSALCGSISLVDYCIWGASLVFIGWLVCIDSSSSGMSSAASFQTGWVSGLFISGVTWVFSTTVGSSSSTVVSWADFATLGGRPLIFGLTFSAIALFYLK